MVSESLRLGETNMSATITKDRNYVEIRIDNSTYLFHEEQYLELVEAIREAEKK